MRVRVHVYEHIVIYHNSSTASKYREITVYYTHTMLSLNNNSNKQLAQKNLAKNTIHHQGQKYVTNSIENPSREKKIQQAPNPYLVDLVLVPLPIPARLFGRETCITT